MPQPLAPLLTLCDGTRDLAALRTALMLRTGFHAGDNTVQELVAKLDEALMLENESFTQAQSRVRDEFRAAPSRLPVMVGGSYPASPAEAGALLEKHLSAAKPQKISTLRGMVSPHIDYSRGFPVYAGLWQSAKEALKQAELAIIFGTDHHSARPQITLTRQSYATPFGLLPTAQDVVYEVARAMGEDAAFGEELNHRNEHSVEAAAVWLHYLTRDTHCAAVPVLCGPLFSFLEGDRDISRDESVAAIVEAFRKAIGGRKTVVIAAADLAHAGPAFGDQLAVDVSEAARHAAKDEKLMQSICDGDAAGFFGQVKDEGDRRHVCGVPPIYWAMRLLGPCRGMVTGYDQCPADRRGTSMVSIGGILLG